MKYPILKAPSPVFLGGVGSCRLDKHLQRIERTRKLRGRVPKDLRPLFDHVLKLSIDSAQRGYCQRAGVEHRHARKLVNARRSE